MRTPVPHITLDAFNLWPGAVIRREGFSNEELHVVTKVDRCMDDECVVIWFRELKVIQADGITYVPSVHVEIKHYCHPVEVYGNVVNPDDFGDDNLGTSITQKG